MLGIKYVSSSLSPSGYGDAARQFITALFVAGVPLTTESIAQTPEQSTYGITGNINKSLENRDINYKAVVIHLTPDLYKDYKEKGKYNIGHLFFETDRIPKGWVKPCNEIDEIWCGSERQVKMLLESGVKTPCYIFPQPIDITIASENIKPFQLNHPKDFIFYSCFQWIARKNPKRLLQAYWKEFEGNDKVTLLLKTYRITYIDKEYQAIREDIEKWRKELKQKHFPKIYITHKVLNDKEMLRFHQTGDIFIQPSSSEGWSRPTQEAMLLGKPVISGDNGGLTDYLNIQYYDKVDSNKIPVTVSPFIPWYEEGQSWWELQEGSLRKQMRKLYEQKGKSEKAHLAQQFVIDNFSFQSIGEQMKKRLEVIARI